MNAEYKRDLQHNYLILELEQEQIADGYRLQMAEQNEIPGLLHVHSLGRDGRRYLHYEITAKQPLSSFYERRSMQYQDILKLLTDLRDTMEMMQRYLLEPSELLFAPDYIFLGTDRKAAFCYFPEKAVPVRITELAEFILKKLDHEEDAAVMLGYRFYQMACEENFSLSHGWKELIGNRELCREQEEKQESRLQEPEQNKAAEMMEETDPDFAHDYAFEEDLVIHKERRKKKTGKRIDWLFERVHPGVLLSGLFLLAVIEILFYFEVIQLTEAGGMFFLMLSAEMLINRFWLSRKQKKKNRRDYETTYEEDLGYEELQQEMYREDEADEIGETCCLTSLPQQSGLRLIYVAGSAEDGLYPDIFLAEESSLSIGKRKGESELVLNSPAVSRIHARLEARGGQYFVKDLNSRNGTYCNGQRLKPQEEREFAEGDQLAFAQLRYRAVRV